VHKTKGIMNEHAAHKVDNHHTRVAVNDTTRKHVNLVSAAAAGQFTRPTIFGQVWRGTALEWSRNALFVTPLTAKVFGLVFGVSSPLIEVPVEPVAIRGLY